MRHSTGAKSHISARKAAYAAANAADDKKAHGTTILDVRQVTVIAEYFVITGGDNQNQVRAIVESIDESLEKLGYRSGVIQGKQEGRWVLLDYGDVIIHVLQEKERNFYKLEQFWNHALIVPVEEWRDEELGK
ncbi:MAG TPA: ribosome silencing factor [Oculatellaceae cyanobacterium]